MRKLIALLLVIVTVFGMVGMTSAAFSDEKQITEKYLEAVTAMSDKGVINGFADGSFQPKETLTRAQAAKIICTMLVGQENVGSITAKATDFADVPATHWASGFVDYCAKAGIVAGVGTGKFDPEGKLTGLAFGKMLLVAHGHDAAAEGLTGAGWDDNTLKLLDTEGRTIVVAVSASDMTREEACQLAYNFTFPAADISKYAEATVDLKAESALYKTYGRTYLGENGVNLDMAGGAIEFQAEFAGDVYLHYNGEVTTYFRCYVDGKEVLRAQLSKGNNRKVLIARNIHGGEHTLRLVRDSDASKTGQLMELTGITFTGLKDSVKATADKKLLIEFIGDSITAGKYTEMQYVEGEAIHAGTNSYAYLTAQALDADWSMICRGGCGYFRVSTCPRTANELYPYYNGFQENPVAYKPTRKADVVVIALGTNDSKTNVTESYENGRVPFATFEDAVKDLIKQAREMHGQDVKIVLIHGMMTGSWTAEFKNLEKSENVYRVQVSTNQEGGNNHPSIEGHIKNAEQLVKYLEKNVLK